MFPPPQQHITGAVMAVVLQLVAVLRPAAGHRERRLGEQPGIAAPAEIQWASGVAGAEVVTTVGDRHGGAGGGPVAREGAIRRITAQQTEIVAVPPRVMIKIRAAEAAKNLDTHRTPPDGQPVRRRRGAHAPCARWTLEARPTSMQHSNPPQVSNKSITINNLMAASPRKALTG